MCCLFYDCALQSSRLWALKGVLGLGLIMVMCIMMLLCIVGGLGLFKRGANFKADNGVCVL
jgi:hypothetical protein